MAARVSVDTQSNTVKHRYRVRKCSEYDRVLVNRGNLTVWFDEESIAQGWTPPRSKGGGKQGSYSDLAIQTCLTVKALFRLPYRATTLFQNASAYGAILLTYRPQVSDSIEAKTILTRGGRHPGSQVCRDLELTSAFCMTAPCVKRLEINWRREETYPRSGSMWVGGMWPYVGTHPRASVPHVSMSLKSASELRDRGDVTAADAQPLMWGLR